MKKNCSNKYCGIQGDNSVFILKEAKKKKEKTNDWDRYTIENYKLPPPPPPPASETNK